MYIVHIITVEAGFRNCAWIQQSVSVGSDDLSFAGNTILACASGTKVQLNLHGECVRCIQASNCNNKAWRHAVYGICSRVNLYSRNLRSWLSKYTCAANANFRIYSNYIVKHVLEYAF